MFHPLKLLSGSYFSGNDVMTDYCLLDQDTAWQLFGSNDVAGQIVYISGIPHVVTGVVERPEGKLYRSAGLDGTCVYVSYATLNQYGLNHGINHYEILMPNPVTDFAYHYVKERLGADEKETEIVENSRRYSLMERWKRLPKFDTRAMNGRAIIYPYWENVARGYEDILGVLTLFEMLALLITVILGGLLSIVLWKNKGWTVKEKWLRLKDKLVRRVERGREKRSSGKRGRKKTVIKQEPDSELEEIQSEPENRWIDHYNKTDGIGKKNRENISDTIKQNEEDDWL